jgi:hypothetical protein
MSLKFKRHFNIIVMLIGFLTFLAIAIGSQPIVAYIAN